MESVRGIVRGIVCERGRKSERVCEGGRVRGGESVGERVCARGESM